MAGRKTFTAGEVLQAADVNDFLMDQSVMVFAGTAARGSAIPSPTEGMVTYLEDADEVQVYTTAWEAVGASPSILQVVSASKTDVFSAASTTVWAAITGLSATITPSSASNKILVISHVSGSTSDTPGAVGQLRQLRDSTVIHVGDASGSDSQVSGAYAGRINSDQLTATASWTVLDSPNTTSSVTYSVQGRSQSAGTFYVNRSAGTGSIGYTRAVSSITLMEVAG